MAESALLVSATALVLKKEEGEEEKTEAYLKNGKKGAQVYLLLAELQKEQISFGALFGVEGRVVDS